MTGQLASSSHREYVTVDTFQRGPLEMTGWDLTKKLEDPFITSLFDTYPSLDSRSNVRITEQDMGLELDPRAPEEDALSTLDSLHMLFTSSF